MILEEEVVVEEYYDFHFFTIRYPISLYFYDFFWYVLRVCKLIFWFITPYFLYVFSILLLLLPNIHLYFLTVVFLYFFHHRLLKSMKAFCLCFIFGTLPEIPHYSWTHSNQVPKPSNQDVINKLKTLYAAFENENSNIQQFLDYNLSRIDKQLRVCMRMIDNLGRLPPNALPCDSSPPPHPCKVAYNFEFTLRSLF